MNQEIFFHVGLSKTGSTFLQHQVFPQLKGLHYVPTVKYHKLHATMSKITADKVLVSREFDQQFEQEIIRFSQQYPLARPIIVFREHSSWAVSNYKRFVKNGHAISFHQFIDVISDRGLFKLQDFDYVRYISLLEEYFVNEPLILFYEDLKENPKIFIQEIIDFTSSQADLSQINLNPKHVSYSENSLKLVKKMSRKIPFQKKLEIHRKPLGFLYNLYANILRYSILYGSKLLPESMFPKEDLIDENEVEQLRQFFAEEWAALRRLKSHS